MAKKETAKSGTSLTVWDEELAKMAMQGAAKEKAGGSWLSIKGGMLTLGGAPVKGNKLSVIVLSSMAERKFFSDAYDSDNPAPPDCYAFADPKGTDNEPVAPHANAGNKQADACADCENNAWKSADNGKGKACKEVRRLALLPATLLQDAKALATTEVTYLNIPVTSVRSFGTYTHAVAEAEKRPLFGVVTEIEVTPDPKVQVRVNFTFVEKIKDTAALKVLLERKPKADADIMFPYPEAAPAETKAKPRSNAKFKAGAKAKAKKAGGRR